MANMDVYAYSKAEVIMCHLVAQEGFIVKTWRPQLRPKTQPTCLCRPLVSGCSIGPDGTAVKLK